jgi:hypothetical protein
VAVNGNARLSSFGMGAELVCAANDSSAFNLIVQGNLVPYFLFLTTFFALLTLFRWKSVVGDQWRNLLRQRPREWLDSICSFTAPKQPR